MPDQWSAWCDFIAATINIHKGNNNEDLIKGDQLILLSIFYISLAKNTNSKFFCQALCPFCVCVPKRCPFCVCVSES